MQKKSMAMILIACLLMLPMLSLAPAMGKVFIGVAYLANCSDRGDNAIFGIGGAMTSSGLATLAGIAGASGAVTGGIGFGVAL